MSSETRGLDARRRTGVFWVGLVAVIAGVGLHLPMYIQSRDMHYHMAGMSADPGMLTGMGLILVGLVATAYGLLPRHAEPSKVKIRVRTLDDARISRLHVRLLVVMAFAVTIDVMKPTSLAFVVPGVAQEYGLLSPANPDGHIPVALLPLSGITGTVLGSLLWGWLGDRIGRRASMLYAGVIFVATAICGTMPSFELNLLMCFIMGLGAGGMLPIAFTLISETVPARHRGWLMVLIGGDIAGAYVITSWLSSALGPTYGWRILWLIGLPTGVLFILLTHWVPESPRYLLSVGRTTEAQTVMSQYRATVEPVEKSELDIEERVANRFSQLLRPPFTGVTLVLVLLGLGIGLVVYGFQLWLPSNLRELGFNDVNADRILRDSAIIGFPLNFLVAYCYHRSTKWTIIALTSIVTAALLGFTLLGDSVADNRTLLNILLIAPIWGSSSVVAVVASYSAEAYPTRIRSRGSGVAAAMTKAGGVLVIALVVAAIAAPSISVTALLGAVPLAAAAVVAALVLVETRRRRLEEITAEVFQVSRAA